MNEIRYTDIAYPLWFSLNYESFMKSFELNIKDSDGFIGVDIHEDGNMDDYLSADVFKDKNIQFALFYVTEESRDEFAEWVARRGFGNYIYIKPGYKITLRHMMPIYADYKNDPGFKQWLASRKREHNDVITLNKDSYDKIFNTINPLIENKRILTSDLCDKNKLPLPVVTIKLADMGHHGQSFLYHFSYDIKANVLWCDAGRDNGTRIWKTRFNIVDYDDDGKQLDFEPVIIYREDSYQVEKLMNGTIANDGKNTMITISLWIFFYVNYFIRILPTCYVKRTSRINEPYTIGKGIHRVTKNRVVLKTTYELSLTHYSLTHIRHEFKCLCWGVRGHYRHLANGKVVFIKPFRKGKERNNLTAFKEKEYLL